LTRETWRFSLDFDEFEVRAGGPNQKAAPKMPRVFFEETPRRLIPACANQRGGKSMAAVSMTVNGKAVTADIDPRTLLVQFLRENQRLTGTHVGCDTSQCGACVVHVDGQAIKSCTALALQCDGASVVTIEGLAAADGALHPMQEAFREHHGLQCGFCTPGMIMAAVDIVNRKGAALDEHTIREELEGNICRCTGYHNIVKAVAAGAEAMGGGKAMKKAAE
jgi:aerobic carbon-monoxide dehydrogenase small subunit